MTKEKDDSSYIISFDTAVLQPIQINNKIYTKVRNFSGDSFIVGMKPYDIVRKSCSYYGSSFQESTQLSKEAIGNFHKLPMIIAHDYGYPCIFLPILSPKSDLNVWFSLRAIKLFSTSAEGLGCSVVLTNGETIIVNSSIATISRQFGFANILNTHFLKRMSRLTTDPFLTQRNNFYRRDLND